MKQQHLNVVAIQLAAPLTSTIQYLNHVDDVVRAAAHRAQPTDMIVLPGGLTSRLDGRFEPERAFSVNWEPLELVRHLAKDLQCVIVGGFLAVRGRRIVDVTVVAEPAGGLILHDATRLTLRQLRWMTPGRSTGVGWIESLSETPVGIATGLEWGDRGSAAGWRSEGVGLVVGGTGSCSGLGNRPLVVGSREAERSTIPSTFGARRTAMQTGAPTVLAARLGSSEMTAICDGNGRVLASLGPRDGEGYVAATLTVKAEVAPRQIVLERESSRRRVFTTAIRAVSRLGPLAWERQRRWGLDQADLQDVCADGPPRALPDSRLLDVRVESCDDIAADVRRFELVPVDKRGVPPWEPGAHIDILLPHGLGRRQYSLCGEQGKPFYEIAIRRSSEGRGGSVYMSEEVRTGDILTISHPRNRFALVSAADYVFVAGGIGITPILPMIRSLVADNNQSWRLFYGGRCESSMAFLEELRELGPDHVTTFSDDRTGPIDLDLLRRSVRSSTAVYCCGPEPLISAVTETCGHDRVHSERFSAPQITNAEPDRAFTVTLARSGTSLSVPHHGTLLDTLLDAGIDVDYSCANGVCRTCELRVLKGTPSHRDGIYGVMPDPPEDRVLACVSRARSDSLTLDL